MEVLSKQQYEESQNIRSLMSIQEQQQVLVSLTEIYEKVQQLFFIVDASWVSPHDNIGIGWSVYDGNLMKLLRGSGSLPPV